MKSALVDLVGDMLRQVALETVLPRYRALATINVVEKSPGELVTIADREAETAISRGLAGLVTGARIVGEEACAHDPSLLNGLDDGAIWVIDPLDGTANFAAGAQPFAMMVALLRNGEIVASWIYDPLGDQMAAAELGSGAWLDGKRLRSSGSSGGVADRRGIISRFMLPDTMTEAAAAVTGAVAEVVPSRRCAGHEYPLVATGAVDFAIYWRTLLWDHAPGVLILNEAGGVARRPDGRPYRPGIAGTGMLLAHSPAVAEEIGALLARGAQG